MAEAFTFELVSPEKLLFSKQVQMVTVPGTEGEYGVMSGHESLITTIKPGVLQIYAENDATVTDHIFVAGGFAEVTQTRLTVLAGEAILVSDLKRSEIEEQAKKLAAQIENASDVERDALLEQQEVIDAKLQVAA